MTNERFVCVCVESIMLNNVLSALHIRRTANLLFLVTIGVYFIFITLYYGSAYCVR